ncbi:polyphosphate polymerase domain-containing protein [Streptococcus sp. S784/96/1]|uniref:polyphosphate polymerase domain-containing protein n=1 Tax=Streptococcus sp. S784/96/1 TaxID=2653499 RepID=UPI0013876675|nr:polyphosphate polymerase domain-containing protein [Streptococcus sp. S784/96/1]
MTEKIQTQFKRVETKYIVKKEQLDELLKDLKVYLKEDDYSTSTISNIYYDTPDFDLIKDALAKKNLREKIRMRSYSANPSKDCPAFLEIKQKDSEGIGHKFRLVSKPEAINRLLTSGEADKSMTDGALIQEINALGQRYPGLEPRIYIYYDRFSLKQKKKLVDKVRITFDRNLRYRDFDVDLSAGTEGLPLLEDNQMVMEIKASKDKPEWLKEILEKHGLVKMKFSKYSCAYHRSQGLDYQPQAKVKKESVGA